MVSSFSAEGLASFWEGGCGTSPWMDAFMTTTSDPVLDPPPQTPNWSTLRGPGQQMPPASNSPTQQAPLRSTVCPFPPQVPQASSRLLGGQHSPTLSSTEPTGQHCADPPTTPAQLLGISGRDSTVDQIAPPPPPRPLVEPPEQYLNVIE